MSNQPFYIQSLFFDIITNGFKDTINAQPELLGFILGAIDNKFTIYKPGSLCAKYGKIQVYCFTESLEVTIFVGKEVIAKMPYGKGGFLWCDVELTRGSLFLDGKFICNTK